MPFINEKKVSYGNLEFKLASADPGVTFAATIGEFISFSGGSSDDSEIARGAGGMLWKTEGITVPGDASMTWMRTRFIRFMTAVTPVGGKLSDIMFSLAVIEKLRQTGETHRESWLFSFSEINTDGDAGSSAPLTIETPILLGEHKINDRFI